MRRVAFSATLAVVGFIATFLLTRMTCWEDRPDGAGRTRADGRL
jgi:hypothetical protein